jgi:GntR family phosphonate transport system transcriptional regulator
LQRQTGVALWRQIADRIRIEIAGERGRDRLPPETELASRFGVNRHTVRAAIASLVLEGVLRAEQGRGTFINQRSRLRYPIGRRTRFSSGLEGQANATETRFLSHDVEPASTEVAGMLDLEPGSSVIRLELLGLADGTALSRATAWFDAVRFGGIAQRCQETGSITRALAALGVTDYLRRSTAIAAAHASDADCASLGLSPGAIVLVTQAIDEDAEGRPVQFNRSRFAADRVELVVE